MPNAPRRTRSFCSRGPWAQLVAVTAICPDGVIRKVRVGIADTFFSTPGRCRVAGLNVSGFITTQSDILRDEATGQYVDHPDAGEYIFVVRENHPRYAALMAKLALRPAA